MDFLVQATLSNAALVSILAPIVLAVDRLARRPALAHRLWLLLLIKLVAPPLLPIALPSPVDSPPPAPTAAPASRTDQARSRSESVGDRPAATTVGQRLPAALDRDATGHSSDVPSLAQVVAWYVTLRWGPLLATIWMAGSGSWLVWTLGRLVRARRRPGAVPPAPLEVQVMAQGIARKLGLHQAPRVWFVPGSISPALWALGCRSRLLVPGTLWARLEEDQRAALLAHELAHLRRRDHWVRPLELFVTALYWWFPLVWWMRQSLREAEEQCCDAWVVWLFPGSQRAYARTLLETIDFLAEARPALPVAASGFGTVAALRIRLGRIMQGCRPRRLSRTGSAGVAAVALIVILLPWLSERDRGVPRGYRIIDLGSSDPVAINNRGQIIGCPMGLSRRAHRWERGRWTDLSGIDDLFITPTDINDRGQVTGWYEVRLEPGSRSITPGGIRERQPRDSPPHAFRTAPNRPINLATDDLGTLGGEQSRGWAINQAGQVAGESSPASTFLPGSSLERAFRTAPNQPINPRTDQLDRFDAQQIHHGVLGVVMNNLGDVVINTDFSVRRPAFHAAPGRTIEAISPSLGPDEEPGVEVRVIGINDRRQGVVRVHMWGRGPGDLAVSFRLGQDRPIPRESYRLPDTFRPVAIKNDDLILGEMTPLYLEPYTRFAIHDGRRPHRLSDLIPPDSGWLVWRAADINDRNQIVGAGLTPGKETHGFLLDPAPNPAPCFWILAGTVLTGLGQAAGGIRTKHRRDPRNRTARNPAIPQRGGTTPHSHSGSPSGK
jgi:beta-lactamase regulating signal transducer with metallopeptidase domain